MPKKGPARRAAADADIEARTRAKIWELKAPPQTTYFSQERCPGFVKLKATYTERKLSELGMASARELKREADKLCPKDEGGINIWQVLVNAESVTPQRAAQNARDGFQSSLVAHLGIQLITIGRAIPINDDVVHIGYICYYRDTASARKAMQADGEDNALGLRDVTPINDAMATVYDALLRAMIKLLKAEELASQLLATDLEVLASVVHELQGVRQMLLDIEQSPDLYKPMFDWAGNTSSGALKEGRELLRRRQNPHVETLPYINEAPTHVQPSTSTVHVTEDGQVRLPLGEAGSGFLGSAQRCLDRLAWARSPEAQAEAQARSPECEGDGQAASSSV